MTVVDAVAFGCPTPPYHPPAMAAAMPVGDRRPRSFQGVGRPAVVVASVRPRRRPSSHTGVPSSSSSPTRPSRAAGYGDRGEEDAADDSSCDYEGGEDGGRWLQPSLLLPRSPRG